jgi:F-type H+-transporting ATPase subunit epsilon
VFKLSIVTPEKVAYEDEVKSLIVPGSEGYLGVLSNHAPLITAMQPGKIVITEADDDVEILAVASGFLEVSGNVATILADAVERADQIDIDRAQAAYDRHRNRVLSFGRGEHTDIDLPAAREALERARNRIRIYKETH